MNVLRDRASPIADARPTHALARSRWRARRHIKVRLYDGGFLLEECEQEPCFVDHAGLASCGRLACPSCGRGSGNLSAWQLEGLAAGEPVTCDCGNLWVPRPVERAVSAIALNATPATPLTEAVR